MRLRYRNMIFCCLLVALSAGLASCSDNGEEPVTPFAETMVRFSVVTSQQISTKAAPAPDNAQYWEGYNAETGNALDNNLLKEGFTVVFTDNNCQKVLSTITTFVQLPSATSTANGTSYDFQGVIPSKDVETLKKQADAKIHVIANAGSGNFLLRELSFTKSGQPGTGFNAIPMWGVRTVDLTGMEQGEVYDAGTIDLLRAMAKVEIELDPSTEAAPNLITKLVSATVNGANPQGFVLPGTWNSVEETKKIAFASTMRIPSGLTAATINDMQPGTDGKITFYLPETANADGNVNISLEYAVDGDDETMISGGNRTNTIHFAVYDDAGTTPATYHDIVRNHLYRFTVKLGRTDAGATVRYTVCPMNELEATIPEFN